ncbi:hypothetical protein E2C01_083258 [Portunus trituberculatus]|jgi:sialic acid synthase SpsE
MEVLR